ncbi:MAG: alanine racemase, partial [Rhodospirillales bacterium]|nr:alanine racemase [Rhodospirillales bacterium]
MPSKEHSGAILTIDLAAIGDNWRKLKARLHGAECAGVLKADAYGLGAEQVGRTLALAGCRTFFVAHLDEGIRLRRVLPTAEIHVLNGTLPGTEPDFAEHGLIPVLNSLEAIDGWRKLCAARNDPLPADIHVDTGMARLGLTPEDADRLARNSDLLRGIGVKYLMSHLACAEEHEHPLNGQQLTLFRDMRARLPAGKASFANSSGIFLGPDYHFDLARPGVALYGVNPTPDQANPMAQVVSLQGKILQVRDVDTPQTVGYGATHRFTGPSRIATVAVGYAAGFLRSLSGSGTGYVGDIAAPFVGRVSMDLITLDITDV